MADTEENQPVASQKSFAQKKRILSLKERYFKRALDLVLGSLSILLVFFLFLLIFGKRFSILDYLGLRGLFSEKAGVYADCASPQNRNSPYCEPKRYNADKAWETIKRSKGKPLPFNLYRDQ